MMMMMMIVMMITVIISRNEVWDAVVSTYILENRDPLGTDRSSWDPVIFLRLE